MKPVEAAFSELIAGVAEVPGPGDNPRISTYLKSVGLGPDDETAWCSAFANWCHEQAGIRGSGLPNARSWMRWGIAAMKPEVGDIAVLWRGELAGWLGHVAFYLGDDGASVILLGGNQGDRVSVEVFSKGRLLGYRRAA